MDNNNLNDNGVVGVDPSFVETVESLDVLPPSMQPKVPNNNPSTGKKILFAILIIALMAGVAFGVWYYLSLGKKATVSINVELADKTILVGDELSKNIVDYGEFKGVNPENCTINLLNVKTSEAGEYPYTVTCGDNTYSAKIFVKNSTRLNVEASLVYLKEGEELDPKALVIGDENYEYTLVSNPQDILAEEGDLHKVEVLVKSDDAEETVEALVVTTSESLFNLNCHKELNGYLLSLIKGDKVLSKPTLKYVIASYETEEEFASALELTKEDYRLIDNINKKITIYSVATDEELKTEFVDSFPTSYKDLKNFFKANGYEC